MSMKMRSVVLALFIIAAGSDSIELPFAKFAVSEDERPVLTIEEPADRLSRDVLGAMVARVLAIRDLVHEPILELIGELRRSQVKAAAESEPDPAGVRLLERCAADLGELGAPEPEPEAVA